LGIFGRRIDVKNATKTTYSEEDLKKLDMNFRDSFQVERDKRIYSPFRKEYPRAWQTRMREMTFEKILDDHLFTFKHMLVVPNPYGASVQTALLLFNTSQECRVRCRVIGKVPGTDFVGETSISTRHRVPIMGLYKGYTNRLELELLDADGTVLKRRDLRIYARDIPLTQQNIVTKVEHSVDSEFPFILVNGLHFKPIVYDQNGEPRYSLQIRTNRMGMIPLQDGRFLYADTSVNRAGAKKVSRACQYHEMDYMGRIYKTYLLDFPLGSLAAGEGDSLFLLTASEKKYAGDCIITLDRHTGEVVRRCPLAEILGDKYQDRRAWVVASSMDVVNHQLILTLKRFHTVLSIDLETWKVLWVLAPDTIWKDTPLEDKLLTSKDGSVVDGYMLEKPDIRSLEDGSLQLALYCIQNKGTVPVPGAVSDDDSRIDFYHIDTEQKTFEKLRSVAVVKSKRNSSCIYQKESGRILSLSGLLMRRSENLRACIEELDAADGRMMNRLRLCKAYRSAWIFEPDISSYAKPLAPDGEMVLGSLAPPKPFSGELPPESEEKLKKKIFGNIRISDRLFLFAFRPGTVQKVYLVGEGHAYVQDFSRLQKKPRKTSFSIALDQLECDEYQVYVEYDGLAYHLKNEIRIEKPITNKKKHQK
jgi:hypothetical protein